MAEKNNDDIYINGYKFKKEFKTVASLKPQRDNNINDGLLRYVDCLKYLIRVIPQDDSSFDTLISLTSYLINNEYPSGERQRDLIIHFLDYWKEKGYLDV